MYIEMAIIVVKTIILGLGGAITYIAYKAYRSRQERSMGVLALGFGIVTLGALLGGIVDQLLMVSFSIGVLIESILVALGFACIMYSLYLEQ